MFSKKEEERIRKGSYDLPADLELGGSPQPTRPRPLAGMIDLSSTETSFQPYSEKSPTVIVPLGEPVAQVKPRQADPKVFIKKGQGVGGGKKGAMQLVKSLSS